MLKKILLAATLMAATLPALAETTGKGQVIFVQGHTNPACRVVLHKATDTGKEMFFRIADVAGDDGIHETLMTALVAKREVDIYYVPAQTTGCGQEPAVNYVTLY